MNPKILLAEDEEHIAKLVSFKLTKEGCEVTIAKDGQEALDRLHEKPWDLLILDVMMPYHDGWSVLKKCRETPALKALPVLMLTAKNIQGQAAHVADLGANAYLRKPFDPAELARKVKELVHG
jgi:DNA-binding response OmpR family regulator